MEDFLEGRPLAFSPKKVMMGLQDGGGGGVSCCVESLGMRVCIHTGSHRWVFLVLAARQKPLFPIFFFLAQGAGWGGLSF